MAKKNKSEKPAITAAPTPRLPAKVTVNASANAAAVIGEYGKHFGPQDFQQLVDVLICETTKLQAGDMKVCEAMLLNQAHALQSIWVNLSRRALFQEYQRNLESFLRLGLKAQAQCRATIETLFLLKNPPSTAFVRQANIGNAVQVNNGNVAAEPLRARVDAKSAQNELLEHHHVERLDLKTEGRAEAVNTAMEAVGKVNRTAHR